MQIKSNTKRQYGAFFSLLNSYNSSRSEILWKYVTIIVIIIFFGLSVRWSYFDNSPPAWDQGMYLYQSALLHDAFIHNDLFDFVKAVFNVDRGRVPLLAVMVQPAFYLFGPSLTAAVIAMNFCWFILAWALIGIAKELSIPEYSYKASFFTLVSFGIYPLTIFLSHNYLVELPLVAFVCATQYSLWRLYKTDEKKWSIISGICIGLGLLTKVTFIAFTFPVFIFLVCCKMRSLSARIVAAFFIPTSIIAFVIAGPYYIYNVIQMVNTAKFLSSHSLAQLHGFGSVFSIDTLISYWRAIFITPDMLIAILCILIISSLCCLKLLMNYRSNNIRNKILLIMLLVWFIVPFLLASFGEIKDYRYIYPGLIPIFILSGVMVSQYIRSKILIAILLLVYMIPFLEYLNINSLLNKKLASKFLPICGIPLIYEDSELRQAKAGDWKIDKLVINIAKHLNATKDTKKVLFLGGNRNYHLRLLDYEGLIQGVRLTYFTLPYYLNRLMTLEEALKFIEDSAPAGVICKSGENYPEFSSKLDLKIIPKLKNNSKYTAIDLGIEQPDGSRFTLFINKAERYTLVFSDVNLLGKWKINNGIASISQKDSGRLIITTETGALGVAEISNGVITVPDWKVTGNLTEDYESIHWNNGAIWKKVHSKVETT